MIVCKHPTVVAFTTADMSNKTGTLIATPEVGDRDTAAWTWEENFVQLYCAVSEICEQTHTQTYTFITILHWTAGGGVKIRLHTCSGECACRQMKTRHSTPVRSCSWRVSFPLQCTADNRRIPLRLTSAFISGGEIGVHAIGVTLLIYYMSICDRWHSGVVMPYSTPYFASL